MEQWRAASDKSPNLVVSKPKAPAKPKQHLKLSYNEQREFDAMEEAILVAEEKVEALKRNRTIRFVNNTNA